MLPPGLLRFKLRAVVRVLDPVLSEVLVSRGEVIEGHRALAVGLSW